MENKCKYEITKSIDPTNDAYYMYSPSGLVNLSMPDQGAPVFISLPHFLHADPWFVDRIDGLNPDVNKHECLINVEVKIIIFSTNK